MIDASRNILTYFFSFFSQKVPEPSIATGFWGGDVRLGKLLSWRGVEITSEVWFAIGTGRGGEDTRSREGAGETVAESQSLKVTPQRGA